MIGVTGFGGIELDLLVFTVTSGTLVVARSSLLETLLARKRRVL